MALLPYLYENRERNQCKYALMCKSEMPCLALLHSLQGSAVAVQNGISHLKPAIRTSGIAKQLTICT